MNNILEKDLSYILNNKYINFSLFKDTTVLITGATGMLGSYFCFVFLYLNKVYNYNIKILAISRNKDKFQNVFNSFLEDNNLILINSDLENLDYSEFDKYKINYIIHAASPASAHLFNKPLSVIYPNIFALDNLLKLALKNSVNSFLFFSSNSIYGYVESQIISENNIGIVDPLDLRSCYAESKRMGETLCKAYNYEYNLNVKIVRIAHTYAPTMDIENDTRIFSEFVKKVLNGDDIIIKGDINSKRAFCYITDAIIGYFIVLLNGKNGEAYNVANNKQIITILELAEILSKLTDKKINIITKNHDNSYIANLNADKMKNIFINTSKIEALGWKPTISCKDGFERVLNYLKKIKE